MNIMKTTTLILAYSLFFFTPFNVQASLKGQVVDAAKISSITVPFIKNEGQIDKRVKFYAKTFGGGTVFVTRQGAIVYDLPRLEKGDSPFHGRRLTGNSGVVLREIFENAHIHGVAGKKTSVTRVNIFKGQDKDKWQRNVPTFKEVSLGEIYNGVTLSLRAHGNNVEKVFTVQPGGDPGAIRLRLAGGKAIKTGEDGRLVVETALGPVIFTTPVAYQEISGRRQAVKVAYRLFGTGDYGFEVGTYDKTCPLVIDPMLASTYLGGSGGEIIHSLALDSSGNVYVAGKTTSNDFPTTTGAYDESYNDDFDPDVFVAKMDPNLGQLIAATYLGGRDFDEATALALDPLGNVYVVGTTESCNFPAFVSQSYQDKHGGGCRHDDDPSINDPNYDVFISKFDSDLTDLAASTYLGGAEHDVARATGIRVDTEGDIHVYVAGVTWSHDFPTYYGYQTLFSGCQNNIDCSSIDRDSFISELNADLTALDASTLLGGGNGFGFDTWIFGMALDASGNVYVAGWTDSGSPDLPNYTPGTVFPTTDGAYDTHYDTHDAFVSKFSPDLHNLLASTFLGGTDWDFAYALALNDTGDVYVAGMTGSDDFPITIGAYNDDYWGGISNEYVGFVSKLSGDLTTLKASTYHGCCYKTEVHSLAVDSSGVYVAGYTVGHNDYAGVRSTQGAFDRTYNGGNDVFISKLDSDLTYLMASTYLGGNGDDQIYNSALALDDKGNIYVAGWTSYDGPTNMNNFPSTDGAYQTAQKGGSDGFISKLNLGAFIIGTVMDSDGNGIKGTKVRVYEETGNGEDYIRSVVTNINGFYAVDGLEPGSYKIYFDSSYPNEHGSNCLSQWYNSKADFSSADAITITSNDETRIVNVELAAGGTITGTVTNSNGDAIADVEVAAADESGDAVGFNDTDENGKYRITGLPTGTYKVQFYASSSTGYLSQWYDDKVNFNDADKIQVTAGTTISNVDAILKRASTISGKVTDSDDNPIPDVDVSVYDVDNHFMGNDYTNDNGEYTIGHLRPGSYKVKFETDNYGTRWYNSKWDFDTADLVTVAEEQNLEGIDARFGGGGSTLGDVNGDGTPNIVDALFIARHAVGLSVNNFNEDAADVNCDGHVNIVDALFVARKAVGLTVNGWCGQ